MRDFFVIVLRFVLTLTIKSWATTKHWNQANSGWFLREFIEKTGESLQLTQCLMWCLRRYLIFPIPWKFQKTLKNNNLIDRKR